MLSKILDAIGLFLLVHAAYSAHHCKYWYMYSFLLKINSFIAVKGIIMTLGMHEDTSLPPIDVSYF